MPVCGCLPNRLRDSPTFSPPCRPRRLRRPLPRRWTPLTVEEALTWRGSHQVTVYRVRPGDSLGRISNRFGVSISEIRRWNGLRSNLIIAGQELEIRPGKRLRIPESE